MIKIYNMDVMKALKQMPDESVDMQICSPPYWGLRDYGEGTEAIWDSKSSCEHKFEEVELIRPGSGNVEKAKVGATKSGVQNVRKVKSNICSKCGAWKGQLGLEPDFNLYIKHLADIFDEVKRVLKKDGTCWINLGDTYSGGNLGVGQPKDWKSISTDNKGAGFDTEQMKDFVKQRNKMDYFAKCLCAIPERFMIEMINRGWILRNKIIWHKPNHMPTSVKDRFANSWEYLFLFSKSKKYYFDLDAVREAHKWANKDKRSELRRVEHKSGKSKLPEFQGGFDGVGYNPKGKNPDDVIQTKFSDETQLVKNVGISSMSARLRKDGEEYKPNPLGKTPDDIVYSGLSRDKEGFVIYRPLLPEPKVIINFLRLWKKDKTYKQISDATGLAVTSVSHWFSDEDSTHGFSYPTKEDWLKLKELLGFDDSLDKNILTEDIKSAYIEKHPKGKNPADFWDITTKGYPEAHFAVFPEALVERPIKTTPKWICNKCGKARERMQELERENKKWERKERGEVTSQPSQLASGMGGQNYNYLKVKKEWWTNCNCNAEFHPAVILDIFAGSGTTLKVARDLHRDSVGIEIKKEYCDLIKKRLFGGNQPLINNFEIIR